MCVYIFVAIILQYNANLYTLCIRYKVNGGDGWCGSGGGG